MNRPAFGAREPVQPPTMHERLRHGHGLSAVYALAFHPVGHLLALGGDAISPYGRERATAHPVQLLDATTARTVLVLDGHDQPPAQQDHPLPQRAKVLGAAVSIWVVAIGRPTPGADGEEGERGGDDVAA